MAQHQQPQHQHEFLPLCDVLFNIISLASYFCDVVFDLAMGYALANHPGTPPVLFPLSIVLVITSLLISQVGNLNNLKKLFNHIQQIFMLYNYFVFFFH